MIQTITPIDNTIYVKREYNSEIIEETISNSVAAQKEWASLEVKERVELLKKFVTNFLSKEKQIIEEITRQMGRPISQASSELKGFKERADYMLSIAEDKLKNIYLPEKDNFKNYIKRIPMGISFVIAPWNYPYLTSVNSIIPSLAAGNSVILKHSAQTPLCAEQLYESAKKTLPKNIFSYLHLNHQDSLKIVSDKRTAFVSFTGSVNAGYEVQKATINKFISVALELGGKDPAYVRHDADIEKSVENLVDGSFFNSGQSCCGIERIYVDKSIFDNFIESFKEQTEKYNLNNPLEESTNLGPVVKLSAANTIREQISNAISNGAKNIIDETKFKIDNSDNCYVSPSALVNVNHSMEFMMEETFGPTVGIMKVKNEKEAETLMNDSAYGLTASIWTSDKEFAYSFGSKIQTGTFFMNRCDYLDPGLAWTGVKDTGMGVTLSVLGFDHLTRAKSYHLRKV